MSNKRKKYSPEFKAKVARFGVHPTMIHNWKRSLLDSEADIFDKGQKSKKHNEAKVDELYKQIVKLKVANDFLSKKLNF